MSLRVDGQPSAAHVASHRSLLAAPKESAGTVPLDAIVVPAFRTPDGYVARAAALADAFSCALLVLCSGKATAAVARKEFAQAGFEVEAAIVQLPSGYALPELFLVTDLYNESANYRLHDAHLKRNAALVLARQCGWHRLLFLNDDIDLVGVEEVARTVAPLARRDVRAAGWAFTWFPDNSVVCHANRLSGRVQGTFVSDAVLAVDLDGEVPFFPTVYNEDWLFLAKFVQDRSVVLVGDEIEQLPYDPYAVPRRAALEEFGDVLAEGLMAAMHQGWQVEELTSRFWKEAVRDRRGMITQIERRLQPMAVREGPLSEAARALCALRFARQEHNSDWPSRLSTWTTNWREDTSTWSRYLSAVEPAESLPHALERLGLVECGGLAMAQVSPFQRVRSLSQCSGQPFLETQHVAVQPERAAVAG